MTNAQQYEGRTDPVALAAAAYRDRIALMRRAGMHTDAATVTHGMTDLTNDQTKETR